MVEEIIKVDVYKSCVCSKDFLFEIPIWNWLLNKPKELVEIVDEIRISTNIFEKKRLKTKHLPVATISGTFTERKVEGLKQHSGLICIDIDRKDNLDVADINDFKLKLALLNHIMYCGLSVSGEGLFCVIKISNPEKHKEHFYALQEDFKNMGIVIDKSCSDITRVRVYSYDDDAYFNINSTMYDKILENNINSNTKVEHSQRIQGEYNSIKSEPKQPPKKFTDEDYFKQLTSPIDLDQVQVKLKTTKQKILDLVDYVIEHKVDITSNAKDWFLIRCVMKNNFGEGGRPLYHKISQYYEGYTFEETEMLYSRKEKEYHCSIDSILKIAEYHNISIKP